MRLQPTGTGSESLIPLELCSALSQCESQILQLESSWEAASGDTTTEVLSRLDLTGPCTEDGTDSDSFRETGTYPTLKAFSKLVELAEADGNFSDQFRKKQYRACANKVRQILHKVCGITRCHTSEELSTINHTCENKCNC